MKKIRLLVIFSLLSCGIAFSQPPQGRGQRMTIEERSQKTTEWMTKELDLTKEQITPIDSINLLFTKTQQVLYQSAEGDREKVRDAMNALEKEKETALSKVLTSKQLELYKTKIKEMKEMMENRRRGSGGN